MKFKIIIFFLAAWFTFANAQERHIAVFVKPDFRGEISFAYRIQAACENLGWKADIIEIPLDREMRKRKYDFAINLVPDPYKHPNCKNYLAVFDPLNHFFDKQGLLSIQYRNFDGYLLSFTPEKHDKKDFIGKGKFPYMLWYPTVQKLEYRTVDPKCLFHICAHWGNRYKDKKFRQLLGLLDNQDYTRFYGARQFKLWFPKSYQGEIPYDCESIIDTIAKSGIVLVIHSSTHNKYGLPSGRIFEAAASSSVIITDQNPFVQEHFGNSVLYINTETDSMEIFNQIQSHVNWIKQNKAAALQLTKQSFDIYEQEFLLEDQLIRLGEFHDKISSPK